MKDLLERKESESYLSYIKRITDNRKEYDLDYSEWANLLINKEYSSENGRKAYYVIKPLLDKLEMEKIQDIKDEEILNNLQLQKIELEKERKKKQRINAEYHKMVRQQADMELYFEKIEDAILKTNKFSEYEGTEIVVGKKEALLCFSDAHYGKEVLIKGLFDEIINEYNIDIFEKRMWDLQEEAIHRLKQKNINKVHIYNLADSIDGILRMSQIASLQTGVVDASLDFGEFIALWLDKFAERGFKIEYHQCWGNHDTIRSLDNKINFPKDNVSKIIMKILTLRLEKNKNINIHNNNSPYIYNEILGVKTFGYHGEDKNLEDALKYFSKLYKVNIDMVFAGHLHRLSVETIGVGEFGDSQVIRVPSICGIDDFSHKIRKSSRAGATLFTFEEGKGKTCIDEISLN